MSPPVEAVCEDKRVPTMEDAPMSLGELPSSRSQLDRLGDRLRDATVVPDDLRVLSAYRDAFFPALEAAHAQIETVCVRRLGGRPVHQGWMVSRRPAKSTHSIVSKLRRSHARLTQIQDIAGLRIVVTNLRQQRALIGALKRLSSLRRVIDRQQAPIVGYHAIHVVLTCDGLPIELQVRTLLQNYFAQLVENVDREHPGVKYGVGQRPDLVLVCAQVGNAFNEIEVIVDNAAQVLRETIVRARTVRGLHCRRLRTAEASASEVAAVDEAQRRVTELRAQTESALARLTALRSLPEGPDAR